MYSRIPRNIWPRGKEGLNLLHFIQFLHSQPASARWTVDKEWLKGNHSTTSILVNSSICIIVPYSLTSPIKALSWENSIFSAPYRAPFEPGNHLLFTTDTPK